MRGGMKQGTKFSVHIQSVRASTFYVHHTTQHLRYKPDLKQLQQVKIIASLISGFLVSWVTTIRKLYPKSKCWAHESLSEQRIWSKDHLQVCQGHQNLGTSDPNFKECCLDSLEPVKALLSSVFQRLQLKVTHFKCLWLQVMRNRTALEQHIDLGDTCTERHKQEGSQDEIKAQWIYSVIDKA